MASQSVVLLFFLGNYLTSLVNGEGYRSAAGGKERLSDGSKEFSRLQRDVNIPTEYLYTCGIPPVQIDTRFKSCDNSVIVPKTESATIPNAICRSGPLLCNGRLFCGDKGYWCCGFERYEPEIQTCCQYTSVKYRVYDDTPEENHVCCGVQVYKRGTSGIPCEHASSNDKFFQKPTKTKSLKGSQEYCPTNEHDRQYIYKIDVEHQETGDINGRYLTALVSMWPWRPTSRFTNITHLRNAPTKKAHMKIPLDQYSPWKKNLVGKSSFTITKKNYLSKGVLFLSPSDRLYRWPKSSKRQKKVSKSLKKLRRHCRRQTKINKSKNKRDMVSR